MFRQTRARLSAFTLIELLVVVAIIALLISILLPSLSRARESARAVVCLSNQKNIGNAVIMYTNDQKGTLPGPIHYLLYHDTYRWWVQSPGAPQPGGEIWYRQQLPYLLGRYLGATGSNMIEIVDSVAVCPTLARLNRADGTGLSWVYQPQADFLVNSGQDADVKARNYKGRLPYYITETGSYFGWLHYSGNALSYIKNTIEPAVALNDFSKGRLPQKMDKVRRPGKEWMIADAWYWQVAAPRESPRNGGTWPFPLVGASVDPNSSGSVINGGKLRIGSYPFHNTTKTYSNVVGGSATPDSPRMSEGKTNNVYFDGHAEGVRRWAGTVNPRKDPPWPEP